MIVTISGAIDPSIVSKNGLASARVEIDNVISHVVFINLDSMVPGSRSVDRSAVITAATFSIIGPARRRVMRKGVFDRCEKKQKPDKSADC
jgi:hypothetical protein